MSTAKHSALPLRSLAGLLACLYFAQGLPGGLIAHAIPVLLREEGVSLAVIGSLKLLALPWLLKVLWAPWVDRQPARRWQWVTAMQCISAACFAALALLSISAAVSIVPLIVILCLFNLVSATQDIATDGLAASQADARHLGLVNTLQVAGYKSGMLLGGSGVLFLMATYQHSLIYAALAALLVVLLLPLWRVRRVISVTTETAGAKDNVSWLSTFKGFFLQRDVLVWIAVLICYKLADAMGSAMLKPMLVDLGFVKSQLAGLTFFSTIAGLAGAAAGGWLYLKMGARPMLLLGALAQGLGVSAFAWVPALEWGEIQWLVACEQFCDGLSTVVLFAWMMRWCRAGFEGTDYTLQASLQMLLAGILGVVSGLIAQAFSYGALYLLCALLSVFTCVLVLHFLRRTTAKAA